MANGGKYLTMRDIVGCVSEAIFSAVTCRCRGHVPVRIDTATRLCRRCYRTLR